MGRQVGLIKVKGKLGGVSFYKSGGEDLARVANGPSKERILTEPNFVRTRENNTEFGGAAKIAKALRLALLTSVRTMGDRHVTARLTALFKEIGTQGLGARGQRTISLSLHFPQLNNFEFNKKLPFGSVFNAPFSVSVNAARNVATVTIPAFSPASFINAPEGATHFAIVAAIGVISDYTFNASTGKYQPTDPTLNELGATTTGAMTALNSTVPVNFTLVATVPGAPTMTTTASGALALGIIFYQLVNTVDYVLAQGNCMKVVQMF